MTKKIIEMNAEQQMHYINLENVLAVSRGSTERMLKYLFQFQELIPERLDQLKKAKNQDNRTQIRQILHKMSPQLQFFGIQNIIIPIQRLEFEYETMPNQELEVLVNEIISKLEGALIEVTKTIQKYHV